VEIGSVMFGSEHPETGEPIPAPMELIRLAVPRRVFTNSHLEYVAGVLEDIRDQRHTLRGLRMTYAPKVLRHFTARFEELAPERVAVAV
jgi:tryptophanase